MTWILISRDKSHLGDLHSLVSDLEVCDASGKLLHGDAFVCITQSEVRWDHPFQLFRVSEAKFCSMMSNYQNSRACLSIDSRHFLFFLKQHTVVYWQHTIITLQALCSCISRFGQLLQQLLGLRNAI